MIKKRRVMITGLGIVAPNGIWKDLFWQTIIHGKSDTDILSDFRLNKIEPKLIISTECSSGTNAIGKAFKLIQNNEMDIAFSGGVEANEGGAILILEEFTHAIRRKANIYAEIIGYATKCSEHYLPLPEACKESAKVMYSAMKDADVVPKEIDYISTCGTATSNYDKMETEAIKKAFDKYAYNIPVSSIKSIKNNTAGAATVSCTLAIKNNLIPPTLNYSIPDSECDLDYVTNIARTARINIALLNSFDVKNNNTCIVMKKFVQGDVLF